MLYARLPEAEFKLSDYGAEEIVNYKLYGSFENSGKEKFKYIIKNRPGLIKASGTGIYPNKDGIFQEPVYKELNKNKKLEASHWTYSGKDHELNFYKWSVAGEAPGVKYFNVALNLERGGLIRHAIKAYYSVVINFPNAVGFTFWKTPWYPAVAAGDRIEYLIKKYPELELEWKNGEIKVLNSFDGDVGNDVVICSPGKLINTKNKEEKLNISLKVKKIIGKGAVRLVQYKNDHWQLQVGEKPYIVKGMVYNPTPVGQSPEFGTLTDWMQSDLNKNGAPDGPYDSWVDKNLNNVQDSDEPTIGDFKLMQEMGVNTLRIYHESDHPNAQKSLGKLYKDYGIMVIMGNFVGMYARDSGATWKDGTDYRNPDQRAKMLKSVKDMVMRYKDEPYILMWMLGNENVFGGACNADKFPEEFYKFLNELAVWIHSVDPNHPVALSNGDVLYLDKLVKYAPEIDIIGANAYRGEAGFGKSFYRSLKENADKPVIITEYGCPAYFKDMDQDYAETMQANYHEGNWNNIAENTYGNGYGNAIGGVLFEWMDEWWKTMNKADPKKHKIDHPWGGPFPDGNMYEEWLGVVAQGDGSQSPYIRQLRKTYYLYKDKLWKTKN